MALWTNTMQTPVGRTGYAIQSRVGTGITIQPVDPRLFLTAQPTGGGRSTSSSSSSDNKSSKDKTDALSGTAMYISMIDDMLSSEEKRAHDNYINAAFKSGNSDKDVLQAQQEYNNALADISQKQYKMIGVKNQAAMYKEDFKRTQTSVEPIRKELAFNVNIGASLTGSDLIGMMHDVNGNFISVAAIDDDGNMMDIETYMRESDRYSSASLEGASIFRAPNASIATNIEYNQGVVNALKESGTEDYLKTLENLLPNIESDDDFNSTVAAILSGVSAEYMKGSTDALGLAERVNNMWSIVNDNVRAKAFSDVLKGVIPIYAGDKVEIVKEVDGKEVTHTVDVPKSMKGQDAMDMMQSLYLQAANTSNSEASRKLKDKAIAIANSIVGAAKQKVINDASYKKIGMINNSISLSTIQRNKNKEDDLKKNATIWETIAPGGLDVKESLYMEDEANPEKKGQMSDYNSRVSYIDINKKGDVLKQLNWSLSDLREGNISLNSGMAIVNNFAIDMSRLVQENDGKNIVVKDIGSTMKLLPTYIPDSNPEYPGIFHNTIQAGQYYIEVTIGVDKDTKIPSYDAQEQKPIWRKLKEFAKGDKGYEGLKYDEKTMSVYIPVDVFYSGAKDGDNNMRSIMRKDDVGNMIREKLKFIDKRREFAREESAKSAEAARKVVAKNITEEQKEQLIKFENMNFDDLKTEEDIINAYKIIVDAGIIKDDKNFNPFNYEQGPENERRFYQITNRIEMLIKLIGYENSGVAGTNYRKLHEYLINRRRQQEYMFKLRNIGPSL